MAKTTKQPRIEKLPVEPIKPSYDLADNPDYAFSLKPEAYVNKDGVAGTRWSLFKKVKGGFASLERDGKRLKGYTSKSSDCVNVYKQHILDGVDVGELL